MKIEDIKNKYNQKEKNKISKYFLFKKVMISYEQLKNFMCWETHQLLISNMYVQFQLNWIITFLNCYQSLNNMVLFLQNCWKNLKTGHQMSFKRELSIWEEREFYGLIKKYPISLITISSVILVIFNHLF